MSNNQHLANAIKTIRNEITSLGEQIRNTEAGEARAALEARMKELMESIGMEYVSNPDLQATPSARINAKVPANDDKSSAEEPGRLSAWQRAKLTYMANKKKFWAGFAILVAAGAGAAYYFVKIKNNQADVSSVMAMSVDTADIATETVTETVEASSSFFSRIGEMLMNAGIAIRHFFAGAYTKVAGWVKGVFNKTTTEANNDATVVVEPETSAA